MPLASATLNCEGFVVGSASSTPPTRAVIPVTGSPVVNRRASVSSARTESEGRADGVSLSTHRPAVPPGGAQQNEPRPPRTSPEAPARWADGGSKSVEAITGVVVVVLPNVVLVDVVVLLVVVEVVVVLVELVVVVWAATGPAVTTARKREHAAIRFMSVTFVGWVVVS